MLIIRLFRTGKKKQPTYKIVVTDKKNAPSKGRFVDEIGFYNPFTKEKKIDKDKVVYWIEKGAQKSDTVNNLLIKAGVIQGSKLPKHKTKKQETGEPSDKKEEKKEEKLGEEEKKEEKKEEIEKSPEPEKENDASGDNAKEEQEEKSDQQLNQPINEEKSEEPKKEIANDEKQE